MPKLTIPSPSMVHYRGGRAAVDADVYPDLDAFWDDLAAAYADEVRGWASWAAPTCSSTTRASPTSTTPPSASTSRRSGGDAEHQHERYIATSTRARGPAGGHGDHHAHVPRQLPLLVGRRGRLRLRRRGAVRRAGVDGFFLEYDDERSGGFEPLRFVPKGKDGRPRAGHHQARRARVARTSSSAASRRPRATSTLDQLCLSPQCGFSSTVEGNALTLRRAGGQAAARRRDRRGGLGLDPFKAFEAGAWGARAGAPYEQLTGDVTGRVVPALLDAAGVGAGTRVLDVGCGTGHGTAAAAARGAQATGIDLADGMLARARERHPGADLRPRRRRGPALRRRPIRRGACRVCAQPPPRRRPRPARVRARAGPRRAGGVRGVGAAERNPLLGELTAAVEDVGVPGPRRPAAGTRPVPVRACGSGRAGGGRGRPDRLLVAHARARAPRRGLRRAVGGPARGHGAGSRP